MLTGESRQRHNLSFSETLYFLILCFLIFEILYSFLAIVFIFEYQESGITCEGSKLVPFVAYTIFMVYYPAFIGYIGERFGGVFINIFMTTFVLYFILLFWGTYELFINTCEELVNTNLYIVALLYYFSGVLISFVGLCFLLFLLLTI